MFYFLDRTLDFGFIIFTILSPTPRNKDAAESALPTVAPFLAATRSASAFARWLVTGLMVGRDGAAPSWTLEVIASVLKTDQSRDVLLSTK